MADDLDHDDEPSVDIVADHEERFDEGENTGPEPEDADDLSLAAAPPRPGIDVTRSALVSVCWSHGGNKLDGLLIVRRSDGHGLMMRIPFDLEKELGALDPNAVARHASWILEIVVLSVSPDDFGQLDFLPDDYLLNGDCPASVGMIRHILPHTSSNGPQRSWRDTLYLVDVGEVEAEYWRATVVH